MFVVGPGSAADEQTWIVVLSTKEKERTQGRKTEGKGNLARVVMAVAEGTFEA